MVLLPRGTLFKILSMRTQGDIAGMTIYTSKRRQLVFYPQAPPTSPPSVHQRINRQKWKAATVLWNALDPQTRSNWKQLADAARLRISGYNLFIYWQITQDKAVVQTLINNTGIDPFAPT